MDKEKILEKALARFKEAQEAEAEMRDQALADIKFANGEQWDQETLQERMGRPSLVVNRIANILKRIQGEQRRNKPAIKVRPVDSAADPEIAKILTGLIRNIEYQSGAEAAYDTAFTQAIEGGWGYFRIDTDYVNEDNFEQDIFIRRIINPFSVYIDPTYTEADASDIKWAFITEWIEREEFEKKYPKANVDEEADWAAKNEIRVAEYFWKEPYEKTIYQIAKTGDIMDDELIAREGHEVKNINGKNYIILYETDSEGQRVPRDYLEVEKTRTIKSYKVMWCKLTKNEILEGPIEKPGKYIPIVLVMGEEYYIEGKRYFRSAHHFAHDAQRVYNWMVSTSVETVAMAPKQPWLLSADQIAGFEKYWNVAHKRPMPYLLYNSNPATPPPKREMGSVPDAGALQERIRAADDIKATTGIYDASLGAKSNETSGVAIYARQIQGNISIFTFTDNLMRAIRHAGRILIDLIPYYYSGERVVRILGPDETEKFVVLNKTVIDPRTGAVQTLNDITQGKYDVVVESGPAFTTLRMEAANSMLEFIRVMPQAGAMLLDLIAENMDWPGADKLAERIRMLQQVQRQPKLEQLMKVQEMQLKVQEQQRKNFETQVEAIKKMAEASAKARKQDLEEIKAMLMQLKLAPQGAAITPPQGARISPEGVETPQGAGEEYYGR